MDHVNKAVKFKVVAKKWLQLLLVDYLITLFQVKFVHKSFTQSIFHEVTGYFYI